LSIAMSYGDRERQEQRSVCAGPRRHGRLLVKSGMPAAASLRSADFGGIPADGRKRRADGVSSVLERHRIFRAGWCTDPGIPGDERLTATGTASANDEEVCGSACAF